MSSGISRYVVTIIPKNPTPWESFYCFRIPASMLDFWRSQPDAEIVEEKYISDDELDRLESPRYRPDGLDGPNYSNY